ncbi:MAG: alanine--tRNA ligase [Methanobrevibacter sp.]|jgi:alanyl-tRNA synthetase|nr:alanine--tRNA ligase [Candidatus Methanovirga aequatorialis]
MSNGLKELGYKKYKCITCGREFWAMSKRDTCGDAPCDEYSFIGNPATENSYDLHEIQKIFIEFFESRGHTYISRYPVLAKRWRDDVFLVGASIYDFQPWVTSGLVDPPANPLTIAQPSIRLNDVDNVGRTGRHMTCFTMGAHHAFNNEKNEIYWKNYTVKLCHDFFVNIGIDPNEITFIDAWWEGGGNAGSCYEVCVRGVELATLVFMEYKILSNGDKEEIPNKTIDTGYGLERIAWISQGTPTAYDSCFTPIINKLKALADVHVSEDILSANAQLAGMMDIETFADIRLLREKVADKLNMSIDDLLDSTEHMEAIYIIADHTRCLTFMIADGIIPSNVKEGYLARLIIRRTIRFIKDLNLKESLSDVMEIQLKYLTKFYDEIEKQKEHIMNIVNIEELRYFKTIKKGKKIVERTIKTLKKANKNEIPIETLMELYDVHGMPPENVAEIALKKNFNVNIPDNFFTLIADSHTIEIQPKKRSLNINYPKTELIFYDDFKKSVFNGEIIGVEKIEDEIYLILDKTAFYPEGGGQPSDIGKINIDDIEMDVVHVEKTDEVVLHKISTDLDLDFFTNKVNSNVTCVVDWSRRIALARNHTATHLIIAAAKKVLGNHIWQTGAQKGLKHSRIDLSHYKRISQSEINEIEKTANEYVMDNLEVDTEFMSRNDAESTYGLTLYQGGVVPGSMIRVVKICGPELKSENSHKQDIFNSFLDVQACGGTHILKTGDIGLIKINKTERVQDGVERIDFSAGISAISSMQGNDTYLRESSEIFKVTPDSLPKTCDRFFREWKSFKNEIKKLKSEIVNLKIKDLENNIVKYKDLNMLSSILKTDIKGLQKLAIDLTKSKVDIVVLANNDGKVVVSSSKIAIENGFKAEDIMKKLAIELGGGGGGKETLAQGSISKIYKIKETFNSLDRILESF